MEISWTPKPGDRLVRIQRRADLERTTFSAGNGRSTRRGLSPALIVIYAFVGLVLLGTLLLALPFTHTSGGGLHHLFVSAFTATSAMTETGLAVEDTTTYWTTTGQIALAGIIFVGGLGFMTLATFALVLIGRRISLSQRLLIRESYGGDNCGFGRGGIVRMVIGIASFAIAAQVLAFTVLILRLWWADDLSKHTAIESLFRAVSAFNNAGFSIAPRGEAFASDWTVIAVTALMVFLGGIGYLVLSDVVTRRRFGRFSLTTKLVVAFTAIALPLSIGTFLVLEYSNPETLGDLPTTQKVATAAFESVSARSGGFSLIDHSETGHATKLWTIGAMLVGGASASAAGGVKINTLAVMFIGIWSAIKGRRHASAFGREISDRQVMSALMIGTVAVALIFGVLVSLSITDSALDPLDLLFEGVSAFGTVGLTSGATSQLSIAGQCLLMLTMLVGRLGPLTIGLAMAHGPQPEVEHYRYPEEYVVAA